MKRDHRSPEEWREAFVAEARHGGLPGTVIGDALAEIDSHCADSGLSLAEAFGDPTRYAAEVTRERRPEQRPAPTLRRLGTSAMRAAGTLTGALFLTVGVDALRRGVNGSVYIGQLVIVGLAAAATVALLARWRGVGRQSLTWQLILVTVVLLVGLVVVGLSLGGFVLFIETSWGLFASGVFLLALAWWPRVWSNRLADRIVDPRQRRPGADRHPWWPGVIRWSPPVGLLVVAVVVVMLPRESQPLIG